MNIVAKGMINWLWKGRGTIDGKIGQRACKVMQFSDVKE
jgi:hypothetical protein